MKYKDVYGIKDVENLIRGTIRFRGYTEIVSVFLEFGFLNQEKEIPENISTVKFISEVIAS